MDNFRDELRIIMSKGYNNNELFEAIDELHDKYKNREIKD